MYRFSLFGDDLVGSSPLKIHYRGVCRLTRAFGMKNTEDGSGLVNLLIHVNRISKEKLRFTDRCQK